VSHTESSRVWCVGDVRDVLMGSSLDANVVVAHYREWGWWGCVAHEKRTSWENVKKESESSSSARVEDARGGGVCPARAFAICHLQFYNWDEGRGCDLDWDEGRGCDLATTKGVPVKRIVVFLAAALAACVMTVGFVGCSVDNGTHNDAGTYNVYSLSQNGTTVNNATIKLLSMEDYMVLDLGSDGKGTLSVNGDSDDITWKDGELTQGSETLSYTKDGEMISITIDDTSVVFQKKQ
jgi:hypothetical protein